MSDQLFFFLNDFAGRSAAGDALVVFVAQYLIFILAAVALVFCLRCSGNRIEQLLAVFGGAALAWLLSQGLNVLYPVARPFVVFPDAARLFVHGGYDSFPSGHATFAFALAAGVFYYNKPFAFVLGLGALFVGIARIIAGVHFPFDIIGGFAIGVGTVFIVQCIYQWIKKDPPAIMRAGQ